MLFGGIVLSGPTGRAGFVRVFLEGGGGGDALERGLGSSKFSRVVAKPLLAVGKAVDRPVRAGVNRLEDRWGRKGGGGCSIRVHLANYGGHSAVWTQHRAVKQGRPAGSFGTTDQRRGRGCSDVRTESTGRVWALSGERPHRDLPTARVRGNVKASW